MHVSLRYKINLTVICLCKKYSVFLAYTTTFIVTIR